MNTAFGFVVRNRLKELGMTQRELADAVGLTEAAVSRYISGERCPNGMTVAKIADALHVTTDYVLGTERDDEDSELVYFKVFRSATIYGKNWTSDQKATLVLTLFGSQA